jgi:hypothetical protein
MGVVLSIYKASGRSFSNYGISEFCDEVVCVNVPGPSEPSDERPAVFLVAGDVAGTVKVVPVVEWGRSLGARGAYVLAQPEGTVGPVMGGCYVGTSDSRFVEAVEALLGHDFYGAVPLHDRFETAAQYAVLSQ